jgi:hypothetical protein
MTMQVRRPDAGLLSLSQQDPPLAGPDHEFMGRDADVPTATARDEQNVARAPFVPRRDQLVAIW